MTFFILTSFDLSVIVFLHFQFLDKMTLQFIPRSPSLLSVVSFIIRIQTNQLILTLFRAFSGELKIQIVNFFRGWDPWTANSSVRIVPNYFQHAIFRIFVHFCPKFKGF